MPTVDIDKVVVGSKFRNNIVTKIDEEVKDLKNGKVKIRRLITLDDGMIVIEDLYYDFEEIVGEYKELQYNEIAFPNTSPSKKKKKKKKGVKDRKDSPPPLAPTSPDDEPSVSDSEEDARVAAEKAAREERLRREAEQREAEERLRREAEQREAEERLRREAEQREAEERLRREAEQREAEERLRREAEQREAEERLRREAEELAKERAKEQERLREEEKRRREAENERRRRQNEENNRIRRLREAWQPLTVPAFTPYNDETEECKRAVWTIPEACKKEYDPKNWPSKEVVLYPPNKTLPHSIRSASNIPHGYWCYSRMAMQPEDKDTEWVPLESADGEAPFSLYLPGHDLPQSGDVLVGEWHMASPTVWPPPKGPKSYQVLSPHASSADAADDKNAGIWRVGEGFPQLDEDAWNVSQVLVYEDDCPPEFNDSDVPRGPWGVAIGAKPNSNGEYNAEDTWFILPGERIPGDDEWEIRGTWVLDESSGDDWSPYRRAPTVTTVFHEDNLGDGNPEEGKAIWVQNSNVKPSNWIPQRVLTYAKGHEPESLDRSKPHGLWGRDPDSQPDADGNYSPMDLWYVFPGEEAPNDGEWICEGTWIADPEEEWLPYQESQAEVQELLVCHPSQLCGNDNGGNAIWRIGEGFPDADEDNWELAPVLAYEFGDEPENLNDKPHGLWGRAIDATPDENGNYNPNDTWLIYPDATPPEDSEWNCCGVWMLDDIEPSCPQWPPHKESPPRPSEPIVARIFPEKKAQKENTENGSSKGIWKYTAGKKVMDAGKQPKDVYLHFGAQDVDEEEAKNGGSWGYAPGAEADSNGNYSPCDLWCFAPGESPPPADEWQYQGIWVPKDPPKTTKEPKLASASVHSTNSRTCQQSFATIDKSKTRVRRFDHSAWVFPSEEHAPPGQKGNLQGVWSTPPGDQPGGKLGVKYKDGEPMEVVIHKRGREPSQSDLKKMAHGKWGYTKDAKPDSRGIMNPKDIIFFPPGVECTPEVNEEGVWSCPGAIITETTKWKFDDNYDVVHLKCTEIHFMDTVTTFTTEYVKKP
ncbi:hypothetical protein IV203_016059 [Nitzschia inconspicua]|uniref:Uncharacterized protein n=1 Tax=Nitzschia inconspicua TaxID=303405 RepID=A0A9K3PJN1_9STRA|nr:hypothetical protein IV203_016059 [Nitzschia inconspicua]